MGLGAGPSGAIPVSCLLRGRATLADRTYGLLVRTGEKRTFILHRVRRFDSAPQLMAYLGLVPSESSTGDRVRRGGITKAGNVRARRVLIEGAWTYRFPARVSRDIEARLDGLPRSVREIAWKAQIRLCARYRKLVMAGKTKAVAVTAIAREMAAFLWAIGQEVAPAKAA
ncbi:transposase [Sphingopyxis sp. LARHCG72]